MPTGYTAIIEDGDGCTFEEYAWRCARAMGPTIMMREDSLDIPVTDDRVAGISSYYKEQLGKSQARLVELRAMTPDGAAPLVEAHYHKLETDRAADMARSAETARRYAEMRTKVVAWTPPTPDHIALKEFMLQQIEECTKYGPYSPPEVVRLSPAAWLEEQIAHEAKQVDYYSQYVGKNDERAEWRIAWINAMRQAVPQPPPRER